MNNNKKKFRERIFAGITISKFIIIIAITELFIMAIMTNYLQHLSATTKTTLDALVLSLLSAPFIYFWIIKPYVVERDNAEKELSHMAFHDHLTSLPNRRYLSEYLKKYLSICKRHNMWGAILLIDLNDFKVINDTHGHDAGDIVLKETAIRLSSMIRSEDIVSRMGGDEFIIAIHPLENSEEQIRKDVAKVAEKVQITLQEPITFNHQQLQIKASIGIRILSAEHSSVDAILKDADTAMYHAKKNQLINDAHIFCEATA